MKIAVIGGAGVRTPLLVNGLVRSDLPVSEVTLYDIDQPRLATISALAARVAPGARIRACRDAQACLEAADFVFTSIRVGGIEQRAADEAVTLEHGIVGQETVGPGGFAMAMRSIEPMQAYARDIARLAPSAWVINFTNPVGMITQAMRGAAPVKVIGICDTPTELFEEAAHALEVPSTECFFDYVGLNHLGWLRELYWRGEAQLHRLWDRPDLLRAVYRAPLFDPAHLASLQLLPTEYVYYYDHAREAFGHLRRSGRSRGQVIAELNTQLFAELGRDDRDPVEVYEAYLAARNAGYMQLESGAPAPLARSPWAELTGYDKIALATVRAIHFNTGAIIPLNVANRGNLNGLEPDDVIEVPCTVNTNGALALHAGPVPPAVADLVWQVKRYERATIHAATSGDPRDAAAALAINPLVPSAAIADQLVAALLPRRSPA